MINKYVDADKKITRTELRKSILSFSGPIVAELMLMSMISIVTLSMVGHLGAYALSAVGLTNQPVFISVAVFQSFNIGATALISRFIGAKEYKNAKAVVIQTMITAVILGSVLSILSVVFAKQIVIGMGAKEDTVAFATMYMRYMGIGMFLQSIPTAVASILRGAGESKAPMRYNIISNVINVIVGLLLINGLWFFPKMGLQGAAIAATISKLTACVMSVYALIKCNLPVAISFKDKFLLDFSMIKRIMNIGLSAAGEQFAMRVGFILYTRIIADLGTAALAAHQIVLSVTSLASNIVNGLAVAASSFTGRSLGAKDADLAESYSYEIRRMGFVLSCSIGLSFFFAGYPLSMLFSSDPAVLNLSSRVLRIGALITFPQNSLAILSGSLRGAGDTKWPLISALIGMIFARVSLAALFVKVFHFGLVGAWAAALADQSVRSVLIYFRYRTGKWKRIAV
jgi:putative MATE family efflux protein